MAEKRYGYRAIQYLLPLPQDYAKRTPGNLEIALIKPWSDFEDELGAHQQGWEENGYEIVSHSTVVLGESLLISVLLRVPK